MTGRKRAPWALLAGVLLAVSVFARAAEAQLPKGVQWGEQSAQAGGAPASNGAFQEDPPHLALGLGWYDFNLADDEAADFRIEYRHGPAFFSFIKPFVGLEGTSDGSIWVGGGLSLDFKLSDQVAITLSSGPGYYSKGGGKDLGSELEFRSQAEISYIFPNKVRVGLAISHLSNAGVGDDNPGAEVISLYYMIPLHGLGGY